MQRDLSGLMLYDFVEIWISSVTECKVPMVVWLVVKRTSHLSIWEWVHVAETLWILLSFDGFVDDFPNK